MMSENERENEKRETLAEIAAEMRGIADLAIRFHNAEQAHIFATLSQRIEAAWEREREELDKRISDLKAYAKLWTGRADELRLKCDEFYAKAKPVGNAAAMREACAKMRDLLMLRGDGKAYCVLSWDEFNESQKMLRAALSKPARNCDRFTSIEEARTVYCSESGRIVSIWDGVESELFEEWLFAPAVERKGEGDENK